MKVLHSVNMIQPVSGILNQMTAEQRSALAENLPWESRIFGPGLDNANICVPWKGGKKAGRAFKSAYYSWLDEKSKEVDVVLLRHTPYDPFQVSWIRRSKRPVFVVFHTFDVQEVSREGSWQGFVKSTAERIIGPKSIRAARGLVAVTPEILDYEFSRGRRVDSELGFVYPNGIDCSLPVEFADDRQGNTPEILFVASQFAPWHGLDLLLDAADRSDCPLKIHLVGKMDAETEERASTDPRFVRHGVCSYAEIGCLAAKSWIGLASLAHYRLGMKQACALKVREYLRSGLPVYGGYEEVFPAAFPFYRVGKICLESISKFAREVRDVEREQVFDEAKPLINKADLVKRLYRAISRAL